MTRPSARRDRLRAPSRHELREELDRLGSVHVGERSVSTIEVLCPGPSLVGVDLPWHEPDGVLRIAVNRAWTRARCSAWALDYALVAAARPGLGWRPVHPSTMILRRSNYRAMLAPLGTLERARCFHLLAVEALESPPGLVPDLPGGGGWDKHSGVIALRAAVHLAQAHRRRGLEAPSIRVVGMDLDGDRYACGTPTGVDGARWVWERQLVGRVASWARELELELVGLPANIPPQTIRER